MVQHLYEFFFHTPWNMNCTCIISLGRELTRLTIRYPGPAPFTGEGRAEPVCLSAVIRSVQTVTSSGAVYSELPIFTACFNDKSEGKIKVVQLNHSFSVTFYLRQRETYLYRCHPQGKTLQSTCCNSRDLLMCNHHTQCCNL